ncbi:hypothetical protein D3C73_1515610 [compost metagenome]
MICPIYIVRSHSGEVRKLILLKPSAARSSLITPPSTFRNTYVIDTIMTQDMKCGI